MGGKGGENLAELDEARPYVEQMAKQASTMISDSILHSIMMW